MNQEEELEVEDTRKEIDDGFEFDIRHEHLDESGEEESEHEESEEESEHEEEDIVCRMSYGRICYCHYNGIIETELDEKKAGIRMD